jgi:hypothetical protein
MQPSTALVNADVRTMDRASPHAEAIAWRGDRLLAVGARADVLHAAGADAVVRDVAGASVLPGFIDAHHHAAIVTLYGAQVRLTPPAVTDIPSLQRAVAAAARAIPPGGWLVVLDWDEHLLAEHRAPTVGELDEAAPEHPVFALHYSCHRAVANHRALALAGLSDQSPDPAGGALSRDRRGRLDGLLIERAMSPVERLARAGLLATDADGIIQRLASHHDALLAVGITRLVDAAVPYDLVGLYREAQRRGALRVPTVILPTSSTGYLDEPWEALEGSPTGHTDGLLEMGGVKLIFDGAPVCNMCLRVGQSLGVLVRAWTLAAQERSLEPLRSMLSVQPRLGRDGRLHSGIAIYSRAEAKRMVEAIVARGFAVATHAIGNEAIETALDAYEAAGPALGKAGVPRIEHGAFPSGEQIARIAGLGVAVAAQPVFLTMPAFGSAPEVPGLRFMPLRSLLDAGACVAASSDHPVTGYDPLDGVRAAVTRRNAKGRVTEPDERITLDEALALYTRGAAEASGCADRCGSLTPGKRADLVVLGGPLARAEQLADARVETTVLGGEVVYRRGP